MATNFLIGYPDLTLMGCYTSHTPVDTFSHTALAGLSRSETFKLATATTDDLFCTYSGAAKFAGIARPNLAQADHVTRYIIRGSSYSYSTPSTISGCKLWLNSSSGFPVASGAVSSWTDKSTNAENASQATGSLQPSLTYQGSDLNYNRALVFDGADDLMTVSGSVLDGSVDFTCSVVFNQTANHAGQHQGLFGNGTDDHFQIATYSGNIYFFVGTGSNEIHSAFNLNQTYVVTVKWDGTGGANGMKLYVNGTEVAQRTASYVPGSITTQYKIGQTDATTPGQFEGRIGEIILYDSALSDVNRARVENYLINKWQVAPKYADESFNNGDYFVGTNTEDYIANFDSSGSASTITQMSASAASTYTMGKQWLGNFWDSGREPKTGMLRRVENKMPNARFGSRIIDIEWNGITNTQRQSFLTNIAKYKDITAFYLYDPGNYVLDDYTAIMAKLVTYDFYPRLASNSLKCTFEELT